MDQHLRTRLASVGTGVPKGLEQPAARPIEVNLVLVALSLIAYVTHELAITPPIRAAAALGNAVVDVHAPLR